jgi:GT2 family glycosyltransferase
MAHDPDESLAIGWCDNGTVDGRFVEGLVFSLMGALKNNLNIAYAIRVNGNQIGRQREHMLELWEQTYMTDWILWIDSDIVITEDVLHKLWMTADKDTKPIVTGTYFVSMQNEKSLMKPLPALYLRDTTYVEINNSLGVKNLHPLPVDEVVKVDYAGFGLVLMHKSVILKMKEAYPNMSLFGERQDLDSKFISEDIAFFEKMRRIGIPLYAHTGALVQHMKRFSYDVNFYQLYWANHENIVNLAKEQNDPNLQVTKTVEETLDEEPTT